MLMMATMVMSPSTTHTDWRLRYVYGSSPASLSFCSLAEYTMRTPRPATENVAATRARSMWRQAAAAPARSGKPMPRGAVVVAIRESVDPAGVGDGLGRAAGENLEDTSGDGRRR